jgi:hypothetical protein
MALRFSLRVCLDGGRISTKIVYFGLVIENCVRFVTSQKNIRMKLFFLLFGLVKYYLDGNLRAIERVAKIINFFYFTE